MKKIELHGDMGKKFGASFDLDVKNPAEAIRALCYMIPGFRQYLEAKSEPGFFIRVGEGYRSEEDLDHPSSKVETIRLIPAIAGASAVGRVILGVVILATVFFTGGLAAGGWATAAGAAGGLVGSVVIGIGVSLIMGGIAELLAPSPPKMKLNTAPEATPSYLFDGPVNTVGSGYSVSVGYGELIVGSHVVSAELYSVKA